MPVCIEVEETFVRNLKGVYTMKIESTNLGSYNVTENRSGIITHPREIMDLRELFVILTYKCNGNCVYCIERNVHQRSMLKDEYFDKALNFAREKGLSTIFLHGGEPTVHPNIIKYAKSAKEAGFLVKMFTNGIAIDTIRKLDGILDEIIFSYRGEYSLHDQSKWETPLSLQVLVTQSTFPTLESLREFIIEKKATGMKIRVHTLNPVNQYSYDNKYVSYLEEMFMQLPDNEIYCASNKVMMSFEGVGIRLTNKSLNPLHLKYSMNPEGEIRSNFKRYFEEIVKNEELEKLLQVSQDKLMRLRADTTPVSLDEVLGFY